jgi:hypothetical protein
LANAAHREPRDWWWNMDFLKLKGKRILFDRVRNVLDDHWGQSAPQPNTQDAEHRHVWNPHLMSRLLVLGL